LLDTCLALVDERVREDDREFDLWPGDATPGFDPLELPFDIDFGDVFREFFDPLDLFREDEERDPLDSPDRWTLTVPPPAPASLCTAAVPRQRPSASFAFLIPEAIPLPAAFPTRKVA
jgi:hypothetical protein